MNSTFERYNKLMNRRKPAPFKSALTHDGSLQPTNNNNNTYEQPVKNKKQKTAQPGDQSSQYYNTKFEHKNPKKNVFEEEDNQFRQNDMEGHDYGLGTEDAEGNLNEDPNQKYKQQNHKQKDNFMQQNHQQNNFMQQNHQQDNFMQQNNNFNTAPQQNFGGFQQSNPHSKFETPVQPQLQSQNPFGAPNPQQDLLSGNNMSQTNARSEVVANQNPNLFDMDKPEPVQNPVQTSKYALPKKQNLAEVDLFADNTLQKNNDTQMNWERMKY